MDQKIEQPPSSTTVSEAYLAHLRARGIEYLYMGAGTDTAPIVEAYAHVGNAARYPTPVVAAHENLAVGMAHGYYMVTGKPQAVMLHVTVGAANAICALMNAKRSQIPIFFTAGRTPLYEQGILGCRNSPIHWAQEMYDQAGMARELVKWDYELRDGRNVTHIVDRALDIAMTHPKGPIYLTLPREVLAQSLSAQAVGSERINEPQRAGVRVNDQDLTALAQRLKVSSYPVIVTASSGIEPATVSLLSELTREFGIGVVESMPHYVNIPSGHPLYLGTNASAALRKADLVIVLECDVPWIPEAGGPPAEAFVAHVAVDPLFGDLPVRGFRNDLLVSCEALPFLSQLKEALSREQVQASAPARYAQLSADAEKYQATLARSAQQDESTGGAITKIFLSRCVDQVKPGDAVLVNEYSVLPEHMHFGQGGTYFLNSTAGGLGWAFPAALGAQQALPDRTVIAVHGDGAYIFSNPAACHHAAQLYQLPVLVLVYNNSHWHAVEKSTLAIYPGGATHLAVDAGQKSPLSSLAPVPDFEAYAEASGGYGERVVRREDLVPALKRALHVVQHEKRHALLNIIGI
ncbi:thiamine pyrophosphate-requiring protein [Candidimonas nitroreducens]|uniref:Acetolactate synthase n=1 Tax=Candidimonas nitroreducens TaxID=683354 RepID=A0A225MRJ3_9BURK|nr:thiamine pyrophosphate-requiring protein [Candidimonas nitroreducens]OWT63904.1 hypothetical protein CEY11_06265 [Candidimonas nitroreducens]